MEYQYFGIQSFIQLIIIFIKGLIVFAPNLNWKCVVPISSVFEKNFKLPVFVTYDANAAANDYLKVLGYVAVGYSWLKVLEVSYKDYSNNKGFYEDKIQTANFYFNRVLPRVESHYLSATTGSKYIMDFKFN